MDFPSSSTYLYWLADVWDSDERMCAADIPDLVSALFLLLAGLLIPSALMNNVISELSTFTLAGFGSPVSLSTLRHFRYLR
jgi:hypothetical protein